MKVVEDFFDYEIIDAGLGMKYERWKNVYLLRPDPLAMWDKEIKTDKLYTIVVIKVVVTGKVIRI